ncbi:hypothetical protein PUN28_000792 [Cardiocondyla obscurior]|uniref:Uncharacterized protein n=1 Tax=Cardiocondyla obscurior TaxID=286306 RepID=A0AAW2H0Z0_9HYME
MSNVSEVYTLYKSLRRLMDHCLCSLTWTDSDILVSGYGIYDESGQYRPRNRARRTHRSRAVKLKGEELRSKEEMIAKDSRKRE